MGLLKFILTFVFFYYGIKILRSVFFVSKTIKQAKKSQQQQGARKRTSEDIIDADYKIVDEQCNCSVICDDGDRLDKALK